MSEEEKQAIEKFDYIPNILEEINNINAYEYIKARQIIEKVLNEKRYVFMSDKIKIILEWVDYLDIIIKRQLLELDDLQKENKDNKELLNKTINYISIKEGTDFEETLKRF